MTFWQYNLAVEGIYFLINHSVLRHKDKMPLKWFRSRRVTLVIDGSFLIKSNFNALAIKSFYLLMRLQQIIRLYWLFTQMTLKRAHNTQGLSSPPLGHWICVCVCEVYRWDEAVQYPTHSETELCCMMNHVAAIIWFINALSIRANVFNNIRHDAIFSIKSVSDFQSANWVYSDDVFHLIWGAGKLELINYNNNASAYV